MTIRFTEEELEYIEKKKFQWKIMDDCPVNLRKGILQKLRLLYDPDNYEPKARRKGGR